jgi:hypothetical protein
MFYVLFAAAWFEPAFSTLAALALTVFIGPLTGYRYKTTGFKILL